MIFPKNGSDVGLSVIQLSKPTNRRLTRFSFFFVVRQVRKEAESFAKKNELGADHNFDTTDAYMKAAALSESISIRLDSEETSHKELCSALQSLSNASLKGEPLMGLWKDHRDEVLKFTKKVCKEEWNKIIV